MADAFASQYGVRVLPAAVEVKVDRRRRGWLRVPPNADGVEAECVLKPEPRRHTAPRGKVTEFSRASRKRLAFRLLNADAKWSRMVTLTYHAPVDLTAPVASGDPASSVEVRNATVVSRAKSDLHRWLNAVRAGIGRYVWVQEFQERGVVHFHVITERPISRDAARDAWRSVLGGLSRAAELFSVTVQRVTGQGQLAAYLQKYAGKRAQKHLPAGVASAGRFWGCARDLGLTVLATVASAVKGEPAPVVSAGYRVVRLFKRWLQSRLPFKFRGGTLFIRGWLPPEAAVGVLRLLGGVT